MCAIFCCSYIHVYCSLAIYLLIVAATLNTACLLLSLSYTALPLNFVTTGDGKFEGVNSNSKNEKCLHARHCCSTSSTGGPDRWQQLLPLEGLTCSSLWVNVTSLKSMGVPDMWLFMGQCHLLIKHGST